MPFNIIYSSGTTGTPKGIVQPHGMRWTHVMRGGRFGYGRDTVTLLATPLYSNTTLVVFFPTLAFGGTVVLMDKFDVDRYLALAERHRVTHTMLVRVQYQRLMASPRFGGHDVSSFQMKFAPRAPFAAALKGSRAGRAVGRVLRPAAARASSPRTSTGRFTPSASRPKGTTSVDRRAGREHRAARDRRVVGYRRNDGGYHGQPERTAEAEWFDATGKRFIRTGDIGRFDDDGFLTLVDRRKDMIISGGFSLYPSDLEAVLREHPSVDDAAVAGVPSERWGETPAAWVVARHGAAIDAEALRAWANERLGKTQRIAFLRMVDELPRSAIGKVLKRELRDRFVAAATPSSGDSPDG
jgi:acyl-CoA synthetase (AMP-forming)/AMP-acid ligase II